MKEGERVKVSKRHIRIRFILAKRVGRRIQSLYSFSFVVDLFYNTSVDDLNRHETQIETGERASRKTTRLAFPRPYMHVHRLIPTIITYIIIITTIGCLSWLYKLFQLYYPTVLRETVLYYNLSLKFLRGLDYTISYLRRSYTYV